MNPSAQYALESLHEFGIARRDYASDDQLGARLCEPQHVAPIQRAAGHRPALRDSRFMGRKMQRTRTDSGIALIIVLIMIVVLGILAGGFAYSMKVETTLARHASFSSELDWAGRSGVELAKWMLAIESTGQSAAYDSLKNYWAGGPGETNSPLTELSFPMKIGNAEIDRPKIVDLDRKFNINVADEMILKQALTLIGVDAAGLTTIVNSILDWRDPDKNTHISGTESEYYESLPTPHFAKDGPIDDLSELLLIRGITPAMYWGSSGEHLPAVLNRSNSAQKSAFDEPTYAVGFVDLFTPLSNPQRQININTASATVLQLIPPIDANVAQAIVSSRAGPDGQEGTEDDTPFRHPAELAARVPGFGSPAGAPGISPFANYFAVKSYVFEVHVTARMGGSRREYVAILYRRGPRDIYTLNLYWK